MEPRLALVPSGGGALQVLGLQGACPDLRMPLGVAVYRPAPPGEFDADFEVDLLDFARFQACDAGQGVCRDDFDFNGDGQFTVVDLASFCAALTGSARR